MPAIHPDPQTLRALVQEVPARGPLAMLNLLRFREQAAYPAGGDGPVSGREAYARYSRLTLPHLRRAGARVIFRGRAALAFIAPAGERWDEMFLVRYPNRAAFERMIADRDYLAGTVHREAALADSRLIVLAEPRSLGRLAWWLLGVLSRFRR